MKIEFQRAGKIGVAGSRRGQRAARCAVLGAVFDGHGAFPVGPVAIFDAQGDRRADGLPVADAGQRLDVVFLDFLPAAAPVAQLPAVQFAIDEIEVHAQTGRQALRSRRCSACPCDSPAVTKLQHSGCAAARRRSARYARGGRESAFYRSCAKAVKECCVMRNHRAARQPRRNGPAKLDA